MAYKVFTNGSVLQASELNDNLMKQSVATFSNAAARTAAITSPVEGQLTYLEDVNRYDHWNGTAWVSPFGLTLVNTTAFTSATSIAVNNAFTSAYDVYEIVLDATSSSAAGLNMRLRAGGTSSTANYNWSGIEVLSSSGPTRQSGISQTSFKIGTATDKMLTKVSVAAPAISSRTAIFSNSAAYSNSFGDNWTSLISGGHNVTSVYDGFEIFCTNSMTGTVRTYGYRNLV